MMNKKAQSQIITTVLIILLVLAAIVIVWQVVNSTITQGGEEISSQSDCLGLTIDLSFDDVDNTVIVKPNKDIDGFRVYVDGESLGNQNIGTAVGAYATAESTGTYPEAGEIEITSAGLIGTQWCEGMTKLQATATTA